MRLPLALSVVVASGVACSTGIHRPSSTDVVIAGTVYLGGAERRGDPLEGAAVTMNVAGEATPRASATSDNNGNYRVSTALPAGTRVVLGFRSAGLAPTFRAMTVGPSTEVTVAVSLEPLEPLDCIEGQCLTESEGVVVGDAPPEAEGFARAFEPSTEMPHLAGLDTLRPLLVTWAELDGGLDDSGVMTTVQARVPFTAWKKLEDDRPGTSGIEVPVLRFDEVAGVWVRDGDSTLVTESGALIPESALATLRLGQFAGGAVALFPFGRGGFSTVALATGSPGCIEGAVTVEGAAAEGATVSVEGFEPGASVGGGAFCISAPIGASSSSEAALAFGGVSYSGGSIALPTVAGACGGGACAKAGTINLSSESLVTAHGCKVSGSVIDASGAAVSTAVVLAFDDSVPGNTYNSLCGKQNSRCVTSTATDESGHFDLDVPIATSITLTSTALPEKAGVLESSRAGTLLLSSCPTAPVQLRLTSGRDKIDVVVTLSGLSLSWLPAKAAAQVLLLDADGATTLEVNQPAGIASPFTLPMAPVSGGSVQVVFDNTGADGYQYSGAGSADVP